MPNRELSTTSHILAETAAVRTENQVLKESNQKLEERNQKLESEIGKLKTLLYEAGSDFGDLVEAVQKIAEKDSPPDSTERRQSMMDLAHLIEQSREKLNHRGLPEVVLEDESLRIPED